MLASEWAHVINDLAPLEKLLWAACAAHREEGVDPDVFGRLWNEQPLRVKDAASALVNNHELIERREGRFFPRIELALEEEAYFASQYASLQMGAGLPATALRTFFHALMLHQIDGDVAGQAADLGNIGALFMRARQYEKAEQMFLQALELHERLDDRNGVARDRANLGVVRANLGRWGEAEFELGQALKLFEETRNAEMIAQTRRNLHEVVQRSAP